MFFCTPMKIFSNSLKKIYNYYKPIVGFVRSNEGTGTGFLINNDGIFVTAKHVAGNLIDTRIYLNDKEQEIEGIYYTNVPNIDLIFYKLKKVQYKKKQKLRFERFKRVQIGDKILTISNPLNFQGTFSEGYVNNKIIFEEEMKSFILGSSETSPGSSGGPVIKSNGKIIGMTVGAWDNQYQHIIPYDKISYSLKNSEYWSIKQLQILFNAMESERINDIPKKSNNDILLGYSCWSTIILGILLLVK